jgi:hypothetical protein
MYDMVLLDLLRNNKPIPEKMKIYQTKSLEHPTLSSEGDTKDKKDVPNQ